MAGFTVKQYDIATGKVKNIQRNIRSLAKLGIKWEDKLLKQSKSIGVSEAEMNDDSFVSQYNGSDYGSKEFIAFYDKEYATRREFLRKFAMNGEIEHILEIIADETVIYDLNNYFIYQKKLKKLWMI